MRTHGSYLVDMVCYVSIGILMGPYESLSILVHPYGF